jgi:membrane protein
MDKVVPILKMIAPIGIEEIARSISVVKHTSIIFAIVGIVGFLWGSASIFGAIESSLNVVWEVKKDRSFLKKSLVVVVAAFIVWVILIGSVVITLWMNAIGLRGFSTFLPALNLIVSVMVFGLIYWFFPNCSVGFKSAFAGAVFTSVFWEIAKFLFSIYITRIVDYSKIFGSLSAIVLMLLWLYYSAYIFLFGAELSYVAGQRG